MFTNHLAKVGAENTGFVSVMMEFLPMLMLNPHDEEMLERANKKLAKPKNKITEDVILDLIHQPLWADENYQEKILVVIDGEEVVIPSNHYYVNSYETTIGNKKVRDLLLDNTNCVISFVSNFRDPNREGVVEEALRMEYSRLDDEFWILQICKI